ncbi:hypothetical protein [Orrella dioscoreae]|uniref:Phage protein n=1 Tax=Orrella dioscoreae TaxID=1851544 RepID=A0A1C3K1E3_9BURK|nr:hypothetical protein [Orrella dioscoreae]SBT25332.1 Phage protein [Orrella dioscoreae]SOE49126.1 Phage protein [Orrella dioscoreae]
MAKEAPILQTFDGGELSPRLGGRTDLAKYFNGCSVLENFLPTVQGPAVRRGGTQYIARAKPGGGRVWLVRFQVSERISYMLEFGHLYIRFYVNRGQLVVGGVPVEVVSPYTSADLTSIDGTCAIRVAQSADTMYIFHRGHQPRKLLRTGAESFSLVAASFTEGPFDDVNPNKAITVTSSGVSGAVALTASQSIFQAGHVGTLFYLETADLSAVRPWAVYQEVGLGDRRRVDNRVYQCTAVGGANAVTGNQTPIHTDGKAWDGDGVDIDNDQRGPIGVEWQYIHAGYGIVRIDAVSSGSVATGTVVLTLPTEVMPGGGSSTTVTDFPIASMSASSAPNWMRVSAPGHPFIVGDPVVITGTNFTASGQPNVQRNGSFVVMATTANTYDVTVAPPASPYAYDPAASGSARRTISVVYPSHTPSWKWAFSLFSSVNGWPEHGAFWRQRLSLVSGRKVALSVTGDFENFAGKIGGEVTTDSAIVQTLNARQINRVVWVVESDELILGTDGDEWLIGPIQPNQAVGPANVRAERRTFYGSRSIQPAEVGGRVLFVQASGQRMRDYQYDYNTNNYASADTTKLADHILVQGAVDLTYQQEPDSIIWAARADGMLVGCTYDQEPGRSDVYAWHPHPMTNGFVEAVETMPAPDGGSDELWVVVRREINGETVRYVELLRAPLGDQEDQAEAFYVDSGLTYRGAPTMSISGLGHLEGQTVQILTDGAAHPDRVVEGGQITLQIEASVVHAGLPAPCAMATMSIEAGASNGTAQAKKKRLTNVSVRMHRSLGGNLGPERDETETMDFRRPSQPMGAAPPLFSGDYSVSWRGGYEGIAKIWYTNNQPLPATILAFMPVVSTNDDR